MRIRRSVLAFASNSTRGPLEKDILDDSLVNPQNCSRKGADRLAEYHHAPIILWGFSGKGMTDGKIIYIAGKEYAENQEEGAKE